jgi:ADP-heptose:LPS heptosyltransferase
MKLEVSPVDFRSVLVVKPSSLGDIVHTLPAVHLLKRTYPEMEIRWVVNTEWAPLLEGNPDIEEVILFPRKEFRGIPNLATLQGWFRRLGRIKPDLALDFQGLLRSAVISKISGAILVNCLGDAELPCRLLADHIVPVVRSELHAVPRYLKLVEDMGVDTSVPLEFPLPAGTRPPGVDLPPRYLLVHPFSRGENKSIPADCLEHICRGVAPIPVVLAGRIEGAYRPPANCIDLLNRTSITELIWLIRNAHFTLSVDSGPMHIAAGISDRVLGIHNWTDPFLVGPYRPGAWVWKNGVLKQMRDIKSPSAPGSKNFGIAHAGQVVEFLKARF